MSKNIRILLILALVLSILLPSIGVQASGNYIDKSQLNNGVIKVNYKSNTKGAVRVTKNGVIYDYIIKEDTIIPLQLGNGSYSIMILEHAGGKSFKALAKETVELNLTSANDIYLQSMQKISWNNEMEAIKKAKELTKNAKTDKEKVSIIYDYIIKNVKYDKEKAKNLAQEYLPNIDSTLRTSTGICYDYSSLFGAMTRSLGIPTKLVMGRTKNINEYHAWNQVYLKDSNEWLLIDTTYDASLYNGKIATSMVKNDKDYTVEKYY